MAPVLSKDAADIEVPTARRVSWGGRGALLLGAGGGRRGRSEKSGRSGKLCLRGRSAGEVAEQGARARRGQRGREVEGSRDWRGYRLGWDLAVYFGGD